MYFIFKDLLYHAWKTFSLVYDTEVIKTVDMFWQDQR